MRSRVARKVLCKVLCIELRSFIIRSFIVLQALPMQALPRLLYVGDVPVEQTVAGSVFFYRLLQSYPAAKLHIVENQDHGSRESDRLPQVTYQTLSVGQRRWLNSRAAGVYGLYLIQRAQARQALLARKVATFQPEAIVTVAHGTLWLTAASLAKTLHLPLHLVLHDDWLLSRSAHIPAVMRPWAAQQFASVYRQATTCWCISAEMEAAYQATYGRSGQVLLPIRSPDLPRHTAPPPISEQASLTFAYAGSLHVPDYRAALLTLADLLLPLGCSLHIYTPISDAQWNKFGFNHPVIQRRPFVAPHEFIDTLRQNADVLFAPLSFDQRPHETRLSFPSKLADYTAVGLPILMCGAADSPGIQWAKQHKNVACVVDQSSTHALKDAVEHLIQNPGDRYQWAQQALVIGDRCFRQEIVVQPFYESLIQSCSNAA